MFTNSSHTDYNDVSKFTSDKASYYVKKNDGGQLELLPGTAYTVTFNANGHGTAPAAIPNITGDSKITEPTAPTADGYTFGGWYKEANCENKWNFTTDTVTTNTILYAKWTANTCTVTFESNEGSAVAPQEVASGGTATEPDPTPTKDGYTFDGWYSDEELTHKFDFNTEITHNTTLYAKWTEAPVNVPIVLPPAAPTTTTVTVPVSGEDNTVNVSVSVSGDSATVQNADLDTVLSETADTGTVTIDASVLDTKITEAVIPAAMVEKIADAVADANNDADGLEVKLSAGSVTFDAEALESISEQMTGRREKYLHYCWRS